MRKTFPFSLGRRKKKFSRDDFLFDPVQETKLWVSSDWEVEEVTSGAKRFFNESRIAQRKKSRPLCVQPKLSERREAKELNCVYKSDNCWETKSFMVEFLTLYFPFFSLISSAFLLEKSLFFCDFPHNIVTEYEKKRSEATFFSPVTWWLGKEEKRAIISEEKKSL